jgi:hypothetical protein
VYRLFYLANLQSTYFACACKIENQCRRFCNSRSILHLKFGEEYFLDTPAIGHGVTDMFSERQHSSTSRHALPLVCACCNLILHHTILFSESSVVNKRQKAKYT